MNPMDGMSEVPVNSKTVRNQISSGIDIVIYCTRLSDGQRKVSNVCEVLRGEDSTEDIMIRDIFQFQRKGMNDNGKVFGKFVASGYIPTFIHENVEICNDQKVLALFEPSET